MAVNDDAPPTAEEPTVLDEQIVRFAEDLTAALSRDERLDGFVERCDALLELIQEAQAFVAAAASEAADRD